MSYNSNGDDIFNLVFGIFLGFLLLLFILFISAQGLDIQGQKKSLLFDACEKGCAANYQQGARKVVDDYYCMCQNGQVLERDYSKLFHK